MYYQFRKTRKHYQNFPKTDVCHFCGPGIHTEPVILETDNLFVVPNRTFYDQWEMSRVVDHLLLVPKEHVLQLADLSDATKKDLIDVMADYEAKGYEIYARSPVNITRSVPHQHTHLIKTDHKPRHGMFFWRRKPYILWLFR